MTERGKLPSPAELKRLQEDGATASDITEMFGVKAQSVYNKGSEARVEREYSLRPDNQFMPWTLMRPAHQGSHLATRLRHAHALESNEGIISPIVESLTREWLERLEYNDFIISYHPDAPASRLSKDGGFFLRPRRSGDIPGIMQLPAGNEQPPTTQMVQEWADQWTNGP